MARIQEYFGSGLPQDVIFATTVFNVGAGAAVLIAPARLERLRLVIHNTDNTRRVSIGPTNAVSVLNGFVLDDTHDTDELKYYLGEVWAIANAGVPVVTVMEEYIQP